MYTWGAGSSGQLGMGTCEDRPTPTPCQVPSRVVSVACGGSHTLVATANRRLYSWGLAKATFLPEQVTPPPPPPSGTPQQQQQQQQQGSSSGRQVSSQQGGSGVNGPIPSASPVANTAANATTASVPEPSSGGGDSSSSEADIHRHQQHRTINPETGEEVVTWPQEVPQFWGGRRIVSLAAGWAHSILADSNGAAWVVGDGAFGQLGCGRNVTRADSPLRLGQLFESGAKVLQVACGMRHSLALVQLPGAQGLQAMAWGANRRGQCNVLPEALAGTAAAAATTPQKGAAQDEHQLQQQAVECTQDEHQHYQHQPQQAVGPAAAVWYPQPVGGLGGMDLCQVVAGGDLSGALTSDGTAIVWGHTAVLLYHPHTPGARNTGGGSRSDGRGGGGGGGGGSGSSGGGSVPGPTSVLQLVLPLDQGGQVGQQQQQQHGAASTGADADAAVVTAATKGVLTAAAEGVPPGVAQLALGWKHLLALDTHGRVWAAGSNRHGQCGMPPSSHTAPPLPAAAAAAATAASLGPSRVSTSKQQRQEEEAAAGAGTGAEAETAAAAAATEAEAAVEAAAATAAAAAEARARAAAGAAAAAAAGEAEATEAGATREAGATAEEEAAEAGARTEAGATAQDPASLMPRLVPGLRGVPIVQVACGSEHSCVVDRSGKMWTWGWGEHGQLGHGGVGFGGVVSADSAAPMQPLWGAGVRPDCGSAGGAALCEGQGGRGSKRDGGGGAVGAGGNGGDAGGGGGGGGGGAAVPPPFVARTACGAGFTVAIVEP